MKKLLDKQEQKILLKYLKTKLPEDAETWSHFKMADLTTLLLICIKLQVNLDSQEEKMKYSE